MTPPAHPFAFAALRAALTGAAAGACAVSLDVLLAVVSRGEWLSAPSEAVGVYAALGAGVAVLATALSRPKASSAGEVFSSAFAVIYLAPLVERLTDVFGRRPGGLVLSCLLATAAYVLWIVALRRLAGGSGPAPALLLGAWTAAAGLAINRHLVSARWSASALAADVCVLAAVLVLAVLVRLFGARRVLGTVAAVLLAAGLGRLLVAAPVAAPAAWSVRRPHLVVVTIDTLRQDVFEEVVEKTAEGRELREALAGSAWFEHAIAAAPWTAPSVVSIMTGLYPQEHGYGVRKRDRGHPLVRLSPDLVTLAERLQRAGYLTEALVANPMLFPGSGVDRGFEGYEVLRDAPRRLPLLTVLHALGWLEGELYAPAVEVRRELGRRIGRLAAERRPTFLWLHLMDPHQPYHAHGDLAPAAAVSGLSAAARLYREEVRYTLREVARVVGLLKAYGFWDRAVVAVLSDHGEMFVADGHRIRFGNETQRTGHGHSLHGEVMRVPLVLRPVGGLESDRRVTALVSQVDLVTTFGDLLALRGFRRPDRLSLAPFVAPGAEAANASGRPVLMSANEWGPSQRALRTARYKVIHFPSGEQPDELYDVVADPGERHDLARREPERLERLRRRLANRWVELDAPPESEPVELDDETRDRLRALGYLR